MSAAESAPIEVVERICQDVDLHETLLNISLVCTRWRLAVLPRLFTRVIVSMRREEPIFQMANSPGTFVGQYVKDMYIREGCGAKVYDNFFGFIRCLTALNLVVLDLFPDRVANFSADEKDALLSAFQNLHTLEICHFYEPFPLPLILHCPQLRTLRLGGATATSLKALADAIPNAKHSGRASKLSLPGKLRIPGLPHPSEASAVGLNLKDCCLSNQLRSFGLVYDPDLYSGQVKGSVEAGRILKRFRAIEDLFLGVNLRGSSAPPYDIPEKYLKHLQNLRTFEALLNVAAVSDSADAFLKGWFLPIVKRLPSPHRLTRFDFHLRIFFFEDIPTSTLVAQMSSFIEKLEPLLLLNYTGLESIDFQFHFFKHWSKQGDHVFAEVPLSDAFVKLRSKRGVKVSAKALDYRHFQSLRRVF